jgi:hypothetical protein
VRYWPAVAHEYSDPISLQAIEYYSRLPQSINVDRIFILDPMVATGNTALAALKMMKEWGLGMDKVCFLGIIASRKAIEGLEGKYPDVHVSWSMARVVSQRTRQRGIGSHAERGESDWADKGEGRRGTDQGRTVLITVLFRCS